MNELKFSIHKNKFYNALQIASRAVSSNSPVPSLSGIMIEANNGSLTLTGSDASTSIQVYLKNELDDDLNLQIEKEGTICLDARYLLDIVRKIDSDVVYVELIDGTLIQFKGDKANYKVNGYLTENYPTLDFSAPSEGFNLKNDIFNEIIDQTSFAVASKDHRPVLTGIHFKADGEKLVATATDSFRLARKVVDLNTEPFACSIPVKVLNEAKSIFADEDDLHLALDKKKIQFANEKVLLQSTLLEGAYPDTDRLIPTSFNHTLIINKDDLVRCLDRAMFIKTDNMTVIRLQITSKDEIVVSTRNQEIGSFQESLYATSFEGAPLDISFSGSYMQEAARSFHSKEIKIEFTTDLRPIILTSMDQDDQSNLQLVLPIRSFN